MTMLQCRNRSFQLNGFDLKPRIGIRRTIRRKKQPTLEDFLYSGKRHWLQTGYSERCRRRAERVGALENSGARRGSNPPPSAWEADAAGPQDSGSQKEQNSHLLGHPWGTFATVRYLRRSP